MTSVTFCWILIVIAYVMELIFALRILELIIPDSAKGGKDEIGNMQKYRMPCSRCRTTL